MTRDEVRNFAIARGDAEAIWMSNDPDENVLLVSHKVATILIDYFPGVYEDPNPVPTNFTRVVFSDASNLKG